MRVTLATKSVSVEVAIPLGQNVELVDEAGLDRMIRTLQLAKAWLRKEKAKENK
jgi:hypothetical protein